MQKAPAPCKECLTIAVAIQAAWRDDNRTLRTRFQEIAASSGRDFREFGLEWVLSVAAMPDAEMKMLLATHYPKVAKARQKREEHERASGHSLGGWRWAMHYGAPE